MLSAEQRDTVDAILSALRGMWAGDEDIRRASEVYSALQAWPNEAGVDCVLSTIRSNGRVGHTTDSVTVDLGALVARGLALRLGTEPVTYSIAQPVRQAMRDLAALAMVASK